MQLLMKFIFLKCLPFLASPTILSYIHSRVERNLDIHFLILYKMKTRVETRVYKEDNSDNR